MKWVRLSKYCETSGDTEDAVHARRRTGIWLDDVHVKIAGDGKLWVNLEAVQEWVETSSRESRQGRVSAAVRSASGSHFVASSAAKR